MAQKPIRSISDVPGLEQALENAGGAPLPDPEGNDGKVLTTDGNDLLWAVLSGGIQEVDEFPPTTFIPDSDVIIGLDDPIWTDLGFTPLEIDGTVVAMSTTDPYAQYQVNIFDRVPTAGVVRIYAYSLDGAPGVAQFYTASPVYGATVNEPTQPGEYIAAEMSIGGPQMLTHATYFYCYNANITRIEFANIGHYEYPAEGTIVRHKGLKAWFKFSYDVRENPNRQAYNKWVCFDADVPVHVYVSEDGDDDANSGLSPDSPVKNPFIASRIFGTAGAGHMHIEGDLGGSELDQWSLPRYFTITGREPDPSRVTKQLTFTRSLSTNYRNRIGFILPHGGHTGTPLAGWIYVGGSWRKIYTSPYYGNKAEVPVIMPQGMGGIELDTPYDYCPADTVSCMISNIDYLDASNVSLPWTNIANVAYADIDIWTDHEYGSIKNVSYLTGQIIGGPIFIENSILDFPNLYAVSGFDGSDGVPNALAIRGCRSYYPTFQTIGSGQAYSMTNFPALRVYGGSEVLLDSGFASIGNPLAVGILTNGFAKTIALWGGPTFAENAVGNHFESTTDIGVWEVM